MRSLTVSRSALNQRWQPWAWFQRSACTPFGFVRTNRNSAQASSPSADGSAGRARWASPPPRNSVSGRGPQCGQVMRSIVGPLRHDPDAEFSDEIMRSNNDLESGAASVRSGPALMRHRRRRRLVDEAAGAEAVEREGGVDRVRLAGRDRVGEDVPGARRRLEAAGAPAAIDEEARDRRPADDRRAV